MKYKASFVLFAFCLMFMSAVSSAEIVTITKRLRQPFGGSQSPDDARIAALAKVKREALEEAGTYIESLTIVKNAILQKDEIIALAAGILKAEIVSQRNYASQDGFGIEVVAKVQVDTSILDERVKRMLSDQEILEKYRKSQQREKELLARIRKLEEQNRDLRESTNREQKERLAQEFKEASRGLTANELNEKALALWKHGMFTDVEKAIGYLRQAVEMDPEVAGVYNSLGMAYFTKGDYISSITYFKKALEKGLTRYGSDHLDIAAVHSNLGQAYVSDGHYDKAIKHCQKALDIFAGNLVPDHPNVVPIYGVLGSAYFIKGEQDKALDNHEKALEIALKKFGPSHPGLVIIYNNIGATYYAKGEYERTLEFYQKAYQILSKEMGPGHSFVATLHTNFGKTYRVKGDYKFAEEHFQNALKILLRNVGPGHPHVAPVYNELGSTFYSKGEYGKALENYQKALEIQLKYGGPDQAEVAVTQNYFGKTYQLMGDIDRAKEHFQRALTITLKSISPDDRFTKAIQKNLDTVGWPSARVESVSGDAISLRLENTKNFSATQRIDVSLSVGWEVIVAGSWCIDDHQYKNKIMQVIGRPVGKTENVTAGMDAHFIKLEEAQEATWLKKAAAAGCTDAQYELGHRFSIGYGGVEKNHEQAISFLRKAATKNHVEAQYNLALRLPDLFLREKGAIGEPLDREIEKERFHGSRKQRKMGTGGPQSGLECTTWA